VNFTALPGTAGEATFVGSSFRQTHEQGTVSELRGAAATESAFRRSAPGKRYVHLATHGFFDTPVPLVPLPVLAARMVGAATLPGVAGPWLALSALVATTQGENARAAEALLTWMSGVHPGLLSGIALAGANRGAEASAGSPQGDDGILTALEVAEMDLQSAELVVLSACDTGLSVPAGGEGLFGLQRAFQVAGARAVVASLWKVDDEITQQLMSRFYANLWEKRLPPLEALRQAQLSILNSAAGASKQRGPGSEKAVPADASVARAHPRLWAAWVLSGDPGDLAEPAVGPSTREGEPPPRAASVPELRWVIYAGGGLLGGLVVLIVGWRLLRSFRRASRKHSTPR
jgi:hypothetical protein